MQEENTTFKWKVCYGRLDKGKQRVEAAAGRGTAHSRARKARACLAAGKHG